MSSTDEISQEMAEKTKQAALAVSREIFKSLMKISMEQQMNAQQQQAELERMKSRLDEFIRERQAQQQQAQKREQHQQDNGKKQPEEKESLMKKLQQNTKTVKEREEEKISKNLKKLVKSSEITR